MLELLLPSIEGWFADSHLSAEFSDGRARLGLIQSKRDLLVGESRLLLAIFSLE